LHFEIDKLAILVRFNVLAQENIFILVTLKKRSCTLKRLSISLSIWTWVSWL